MVLGDIGRSPRMTFHSMSLAQEGYQVDLVGFSGSTPSQSLLENSNIAIHLLREPPLFLKKLPKIIEYGFKVVWIFFSLLFTLFTLQKPGYILAQNPPSVPMLAVIWCFSCIKSCKIIIDWHNYGYTILGLTLGPRHPLVRFSKWFEIFFGKKADAHLCVTKALKKDLKAKWKIKAKLLYDWPTGIFHPTTVAEKHQLFLKLKEYKCFNSEPECDNETAFTIETANEIQYKEKRPALIISSTSWTQDEDFSLLLDALEAYNNAIVETQATDLPDIICAITGKGPMREFYANKILLNPLEHVKFCLIWLTAEDYPAFLACGDLGISLHTSSSGLDLPMKVVDMFGAGLPVLAYDFECLSELVKHKENGLVFHNSEELKEHLMLLFRNFPSDSKMLQTFRCNLKTFQELRWDESWKRAALPLFR